MSNTSDVIGASAPPAARDETFRKIIWRLIPFLTLVWFLAWIDRVNIGFAKLTMMDELGWSDAVYGAGAGIFFLGYFSLKFPVTFCCNVSARPKPLCGLRWVGVPLRSDGIRQQPVAILRAALLYGRVRGRASARRYPISDLLATFAPARQGTCFSHVGRGHVVDARQPNCSLYHDVI